MRARLRLALAVLAFATIAVAQSCEADLRRAIDVAARHPISAAALPQYPGWTASGYDAQSRDGVWRVDFAAAGGAPIGWAQVQLEAGRVLSWEGKFGLEGEGYAVAEAALLDFLRHDPEFVAFAGDVDERDWVWVGYEDWRDTWVVQLERGPESLTVILSSAHAWARSLGDLRIVQTTRHWTWLLDFWADLFDAYFELPGRRRRGPLGRRLAATLTAAERDPATVAAVLRDACVVPFSLTQIGAQGRWLATVPDERDGEIVDVDALGVGFGAPPIGGAARREWPLVATERPAQADGVRRGAATVSGMGAAFDDVVRAGTRVGGVARRAVRSRSLP